ncbi:MAG: DUF1731 domain-containing protein [Spirosomataceae bacterium]
MNKPLWMPNVPAFTLKLLYGEMASVVLGGNYIENQRIKNETKFIYQFETIDKALAELAVK